MAGEKSKKDKTREKNAKERILRDLTMLKEEFGICHLLVLTGDNQELIYGTPAVKQKFEVAYQEDPEWIEAFNADQEHVLNRAEEAAEEAALANANLEPGEVQVTAKERRDRIVHQEKINQRPDLLPVPVEVCRFLELWKLISK